MPEKWHEQSNYYKLATYLSFEEASQALHVRHENSKQAHGKPRVLNVGHTVTLCFEQMRAMRSSRYTRHLVAGHSLQGCGCLRRKDLRLVHKTRAKENLEITSLEVCFCGGKPWTSRLRTTQKTFARTRSTFYLQTFEKLSCDDLLRGKRGKKKNQGLPCCRGLLHGRENPNM